MIIEVEATPNPATLKFVPPLAVLESGTLDVRTLEDAAASPLASRLMSISGVGGVLLAPSFVAVTNEREHDWGQLKQEVTDAIVDFFESGEPVLQPDPAQQADNQHGADFDPKDQQVVRTIRELLDTRIRPAVAMDGGDVLFHSFRDGVVFLHMRGACSGCPISSVTLKQGIENLLQHFIPDVKEVRQIEVVE